MRSVTFADLCQAEPRLLGLEWDVLAVEDDPDREWFCANAHWYGIDGFKQRLSQIVGWGRRPSHPLLSSSRAYDVAYDALYELLPDCRGHCPCIAIQEVLIG